MFNRKCSQKKAYKSNRNTQKPITKLYGNFKKLQDIYNSSGLYSIEFYNQTIAYVKKLLNKYLYQKQFNEDNINDCFVAIYEKVEKNYDSDKGCLGTFIHTVIRNYCTKVNYKLVHVKNPISLDFEYINKEELNNQYLDELGDSEDFDNEVEEELDNIEYYCTSLQLEEAYDRIEYYCDVITHLEDLSELDSRDIKKLNKLDAVRRDLLWSVWKHNSRG